MPYRYPPEFRRRVLDLLAVGRSVASLSADLGVSDQTIYNWRRQDRIDRGLEPGATSEEQAELWAASQRRDGYKAHIAAEPDTGIVTACEITGATTADGPAGVELLGGEPSDTDVIADSAYGSGEVRAKLRAAGHRAIIKPIGQRRNPRLGPDQFTRDNFVIDHDHRQVTCPAGSGPQ